MGFVIEVSGTSAFRGCAEGAWLGRVYDWKAVEGVDEKWRRACCCSILRLPLFWSCLLLQEKHTKAEARLVSRAPAFILRGFPTDFDPVYGCAVCLKCVGVP